MMLKSFSGWKPLTQVQGESEKARGREIHKELLPTQKLCLAQEIPELQMPEGWESIQENKIHACPPAPMVPLRHLPLAIARNETPC